MGRVTAMAALLGVPPRLVVTDLGRLAYAPALAAQHAAHARVVAGGSAELLLVEHDPVITVSQRPGARQHLLAPPALLAKLGIDVQPTDRGGDITYHGPGQLVGYPILRLSDHALGVGGYMRLLEEAAIGALAALGVEGRREPGATGVWVREEGERRDKPQAGDAGPGASAKIAAMGVRVRRGVTLHGLALNVNPDLSHFDTIVPCGLVGRSVTSLERLLGEGCPPIGRVKTELVAAVERALAARAVVARGE